MDFVHKYRYHSNMVFQLYWIYHISFEVAPIQNQIISPELEDIYPWCAFDGRCVLFEVFQEKTTSTISKKENVVCSPYVYCWAIVSRWHDKFWRMISRCHHRYLITSLNVHIASYLLDWARKIEVTNLDTQGWHYQYISRFYIPMPDIAEGLKFEYLKYFSINMILWHLCVMWKYKQHVDLEVEGIQTQSTYICIDSLLLWLLHKSLVGCMKAMIILAIKSSLLWRKV